MLHRLFLVLTFALAGAARGEPPPMAAAGVLERNGRTDCSAVLIAPDLIATAAHCVAGRALVSQGGEDTVIFRTGAYPRHLSQDFGVAEIAVHPLFGAQTELPGSVLGTDVALGRLAGSVPADVARPLQLGDPVAQGMSVLLATWPGGAGARARERRCPVLEVDQTVARLSCVVIPGESGGAVLRLSEGGPELVAILVATARAGHQPFGFAVHAKSRIGQLRAIHGF